MEVQESHLDERPVPAKDEVVCREGGFKHARTVRAPGCMGHTHGGRSCNDVVDEMAICLLSGEVATCSRMSQQY